MRVGRYETICTIASGGGHGDADGDGQLVNRILNEEVPTPRSICADVPEPIERACWRALARQVKGRYASAEDRHRVVDHVRALGAIGDPVGQRQPGAVARRR